MGLTNSRALVTAIVTCDCSASVLVMLVRLVVRREMFQCRDA